MFSGLERIVDYCVNPMLTVQRGLSLGQAVPVVGPLIVSPVKFCVSAIQCGIALPVGIVAAVAAGVFCCNCQPLTEFALASLVHAGMGGVGMTYSVVNILSLGILGFKLEGLDKKFCQGYSQI